MSDILPDALQENLLTLLIFDNEACALIRNTVEVDLYTNRHIRTIAARAYAYIDRYACAPKDHLADELEDVLIRDDAEAQLTSTLLGNAAALHETINREYVLTKLQAFVRQQALKVGIKQAHELVLAGDLDAAEAALERATKQRGAVFEAGKTLLNVAQDIVSGKNQRDPIQVGIKELDRLGLGPARKELHTFIAPPKKGKSWWLVHVAKCGIIQRWKGVVITLEMGEEQWGGRELQALFGLTTRADPFDTTHFDWDRDRKRIIGFTQTEKTRPSIRSDETATWVVKQVNSALWKDRLRIKQFPTGSLTVSGLNAYLDMLERLENFVPDFVIIDYPDLMKTRTEYLRGDTSQTYKDIRGIAVERNLAMIVASQANRIGAGSSTITDTMVAEDFSKIAISDVVLTYNQTMAERRLGLARIYVANGRMEADRFLVLLSQSYHSGQFVLESASWAEEYRKLIVVDDEGEGDD